MFQKLYGEWTLQVWWFKVPTKAWPSGGLRLVTDKTKKNKPKASHDPRTPMAARLIKVLQETFVIYSHSNFILFV